MNDNNFRNRIDIGKEISFLFNGRRLKGLEGQPIAVALFVNGIRTIRICEITGEARGIYCGIGHCYECRVTVNGMPGKRACLTLLEKNMDVSSENSVLGTKENISFE